MLLAGIRPSWTPRGLEQAENQCHMKLQKIVIHQSFYLINCFRIKRFLSITQDGVQNTPSYGITSESTVSNSRFLLNEQPVQVDAHFISITAPSNFLVILPSEVFVASSHVTESCRGTEM